LFVPPNAVLSPRQDVVLPAAEAAVIGAKVPAAVLR
jgi:hypothetical protein